MAALGTSQGKAAYKMTKCRVTGVCIADSGKIRFVEEYEA
jgi:hypothetical protein